MVAGSWAPDRIHSYFFFFFTIINNNGKTFVNNLLDPKKS